MRKGYMIKSDAIVGVHEAYTHWLPKLEEEINLAIKNFVLKNGNGLVFGTVKIERIKESDWEQLENEVEETMRDFLAGTGRK